MHIEKRNWLDISKSIKAHNKSLYNAIDDIVTISDLFYEVSYKYGEDIIIDGKLNGYQNFDNLDYAKIPLSIVIDKNVELFIDNKNRDIPLNLLNAGSIFGTYEILDSTYNTDNQPMWSISAGVRNIMSLQKLTELARFKNLCKEYNISGQDFPSSYNQHFNLFKKIPSKSWRCKVIYFPKSIIQPVIDKKISHHLLSDFITGYSWLSVNSSVEIMKNNLHWEKLSIILNNRNIKVDQLHYETLKHLIQISKSNAPAFRITNIDDAPIDEIKNALKNVYGCRYKPDLISLSSTNDLSNQDLYYSFMHPTLLDGNIMLADDLRSYYAYCEKIAYIIKVLNQSLGDDSLPITIYSSKKGIKSSDLVQPAYKLGLDVAKENLNSSKFFRAMAKISKNHPNNDLV